MERHCKARTASRRSSGMAGRGTRPPHRSATSSMPIQPLAQWPSGTAERTVPGRVAMSRTSWQWMARAMRSLKSTTGRTICGTASARPRHAATSISWARPGIEAILEPTGNVGPGTAIANLLVPAREHGIDLAFQGERRDGLDLATQGQVTLDGIRGRDGHLIARLRLEQEPFNHVVGRCLPARIDDLDAIDGLRRGIGVRSPMGIEDDGNLLARHGRVVGEDGNQQISSVLQFDVLDRRKLRPGKDDVVAVDDQPLHSLSLRPGHLRLLAW